MATNSNFMAEGVAMLWNQKFIDLVDWRDNNFSLMTNFHFLETRAKGTLVNVYGPKYFP